MIRRILSIQSMGHSPRWSRNREFSVVDVIISLVPVDITDFSIDGALILPDVSNVPTERGIVDTIRVRNDFVN